MKKFILSIILVFVCIELIDARDIITKDVNELPVKSREIIQSSFPDQEISFIKIDNESFGNKVYEVTFLEGSEIEFNTEGEWIEVDGKRRRVPDYFLIPAIQTYVTDNFRGTYVTKIEKERRGYKVELNNDLDLYFDWNGRLMEIDD